MPDGPSRRPDWTRIIPIVAVVAAITAGFLYGATPSSPEAKPSYAEGEKPDPIKVNGPIFEGWPKPNVAVVFTAEQAVYLEPCGCAGLENQKGGLKRRFTMLKELRDKGWPLIAVDGGGQDGIRHPGNCGAASCRRP